MQLLAVSGSRFDRACHVSAIPQSRDATHFTNEYELFEGYAYLVVQKKNYLNLWYLTVLRSFAENYEKDPVRIL